MKKIMIPTTYIPYEIPEYKEYNVPNKVVEYIEYLEKQENFKLLQRINKAIEYIENEFYEVGGCVGGSDLPYQPIQDLLNILKGEDNE